MNRKLVIAGMCVLITLAAVADTQEGQASPDGFMQLVFQASELRDAKDKEGAVACYQEAIRLYPEHPYVLDIEQETAITLGGEKFFNHLRKVLDKYDYNDYYTTSNAASLTDTSIALPHIAYQTGLSAHKHSTEEKAREYFTLCLDMLSQTHERRAIDWLESPPPNLAYQSIPQRREEALKAHEARRARAAEGPLWVVEKSMITHLLDGKPMGFLYMEGGYRLKPELTLIGLSSTQYALSYPEEERVLAMRKLQARYPKGNPVWTAIDYVIKYYSK